MVTFTDSQGCNASGFFIVSEPTALYTANLLTIEELDTQYISQVLVTQTGVWVTGVFGK